MLPRFCPLVTAGQPLRSHVPSAGSERRAASVLQRQALGNASGKPHFNNSGNIHFSIKKGGKKELDGTPTQ